MSYREELLQAIMDCCQKNQDENCKIEKECVCFWNLIVDKFSRPQVDARKLVNK
jgi:hypothetical protein